MGSLQQESRDEMMLAVAELRPSTSDNDGLKLKLLAEIKPPRILLHAEKFPSASSDENGSVAL